VPLLGRPPRPGATSEDRRAAKQCLSPRPLQDNSRDPDTRPARRDTSNPLTGVAPRVVSLCGRRVTWPPLGSWPRDSRLPNAMPRKQLRRAGRVTWPPGHSAAGALPAPPSADTGRKPHAPDAAGLLPRERVAKLLGGAWHAFDTPQAPSLRGLARRPPGELPTAKGGKGGG
jgi:hypothetical protein